MNVGDSLNHMDLIASFLDCLERNEWTKCQLLIPDEKALMEINVVIRAKLNYLIARYYFELSQYQKCEMYLRNSSDDYKACPQTDIIGCAATFNLLGELHLTTLSYQEAIKCLNFAKNQLDTLKELNHNEKARKQYAKILINFGRVYQELGQYDDTFHSYDAALTYIKEDKTPESKEQIVNTYAFDRGLVYFYLSRLNCELQDCDNEIRNLTLAEEQLGGFYENKIEQNIEAGAYLAWTLIYRSNVRQGVDNDVEMAKCECALEIAKKLLQESPDSIKAGNAAGSALIYLARNIEGDKFEIFDEAERIYNKFLKLAPNNQGLLRNKAILIMDKSQYYLSVNNHDEVVTCIDKGIKYINKATSPIKVKADLEMTRSYAYQYLAELERTRNCNETKIVKYYKKAIETIDKILMEYPNKVSVLYSKAMMYVEYADYHLEAHDYKKAKTIYMEAQNTIDRLIDTPCNKIMVLWAKAYISTSYGTMLLDTEDFDASDYAFIEAIEGFDKVITLEGDKRQDTSFMMLSAMEHKAWTYLKRGDLYQKNGEVQNAINLYKESLTYYEEIERCNPKNTVCRKNIMWLRRQIPPEIEVAEIAVSEQHALSDGDMLTLQEQKDFSIISPEYYIKSLHLTMKPITENEKQEFLCRVEEQDQDMGIGRDNILLTAANLSFYQSYQLMMLQDQSGKITNPIFYLYNTVDARLLDYTNRVIYDINSVDYAFNGKGDVFDECALKDYLRFFFWFVRSDLGRFNIVENSEDVDWLPEADEKDKRQVNEKLRSIRYITSDSIYHIFDTTVIFKNALFTTNIKIVHSKAKVFDSYLQESVEYQEGQVLIENQNLLLEGIKVR